ncbi:MAG: methionine--tRNA ligase [Candidatus Eremiobacter antarcticus]|nr:methionine--tRNA ligase [Candidatus Eremiobacteraeota bacterium]MBC5808010.1 methionine--tRNA ligase [Candidatus Eremiobacteraeota bacterium]PZR62633.1 MAG: methionine--tRNA ligase [Candidatus Eremiobacter sp. RRmetagenome_bin22]
MPKDTFYITTPLYYTNSTPHIGHAYSTIAADILARYHRVAATGRTHFLTGTDEHGQKIADAAAAAGKPPKEFCDEIVERWKRAWRDLDISYDQFIRTTDAVHESAVQQIFLKLREQGDIVAGVYEGWYCRNDETFWPEAKLIDGRCPNPECGRKVEWVSEDAWFFRLSAYRDRLGAHFHSHPAWVRPASAWNEMASLLRGGLDDLCVSRASVAWGIPIPGEDKTIYVWLDAICNYITAAGYPHDMERFATLWPADVQLIGKEILRFHTIIWPALLMALDLPLPKLVFANGWITMEGQKMSKSVGNVVRPAELTDRYSVDAIRYVLFAQAPFGVDFSFSEEALLRRYNAELANDFGNLVQRVLSMLVRYRQGVVPARSPGDELNVEFESALASVRECLQDVDFRGALSAIWERVGALNLYVEQSKPWVLHKAGDAAMLDGTLYNLCEGIRWIAALIYPFMPASAASVWSALGQTGVPGATWEERLRWGGLAPGQTVTMPPSPFPRVEREASPA